MVKCVGQMFGGNALAVIGRPYVGHLPLGAPAQVEVGPKHWTEASLHRTTSSPAAMKRSGMAVGCSTLSGLVVMFHSDDHFSLGLSTSIIPESFSSLT